MTILYKDTNFTLRIYAPDIKQLKYPNIVNIAKV